MRKGLILDSRIPQSPGLLGSEAIAGYSKDESRMIVGEGCFESSHDLSPLVGGVEQDVLQWVYMVSLILSVR